MVCSCPVPRRRIAQTGRRSDPGAEQTHHEDAEDCKKLTATALTDHRVPLFFLVACQGKLDPTASVAGRLLLLLQGGDHESH
ncbi:MAG: hypothetical protein GXP17_04070 [Gammaproteobacteria bacterium]|nr:hypothetical protein [Gammaproteobacteria bacterium]